MTIVFFCNTLNNHQSSLSDALYELIGENYVFVESVPQTANVVGKEHVVRSYVLTAYTNAETLSEAYRLAREADVALFGAESFCFEIERMRANHSGLSFEVSERWFKRDWLNVLSPRLLKNQWYYHTRRWKEKPMYKLCSSAYGANDQYMLHSFINRCYKWGYFTKVNDFYPRSIEKKNPTSPVRIMWCARFLKWKHPEMVVYLSKYLKDKGYNAHIEMYGKGNQYERTRALVSKMDLDDMISFWGNVPNEDILSAMRRNDLFLVTSDKREGWGVVLNEAMSNGCAVVASDAIGSAPYLIEDGVNGFMYKSLDVESLIDKVVYLIENPSVRECFSLEAYKTMRTTWSPQNAATNLLRLCRSLLNNEGINPISSGPCSKATPYPTE